MHLDDERLQRLLHGELAPSALGPVDAHLADCLECRQRVTLARREEQELFALLRQIDHAPPRVNARAIVTRATLRPPRALRWAAGLLLTAALASAAWAVPGSPLPAIAELVEGWLDRDGLPDPVPAPQGQATDVGRVTSGIAVLPGASLVIEFTAAANGAAHLRFTDSAYVKVLAPVGAATYTATSDRILVDNRAGTDTFDIEIPRSAPRIEVRVAGARTYLTSGGGGGAREIWMPLSQR